ncbi:MAG TPA: cytochrome d ubiquinol oxidase subunit II [Nitrospira sp.]|nr:cytochrome d ubiquinol oxidase subunit II [Nitrospira sp.]
MGMLELVLGASIVGALTCYLLTGGADFGAGIWTLFTFGRKGQQQRALIDQAIGPIWEANHVWLIVAVTILFTAFPAAFALIATGLHLPLSLMLIGIVLRGTAFAVRTHDITSRTDGSSSTPSIWRYVFAGSSLITPALLGISLGAVASGRLIAVSSPGTFTERFVDPWLAPFPLSVGFLTISLVAYLAAVYLLVEARDAALRASFRRRAMVSCGMVLCAAGIALWEARSGAPEIYAGLLRTGLGGTTIFVAIAVHLAALMALWNEQARAARWCAIAGAVLILWGWALSQYPFLVEPYLTIAHAAPPPTLRLLVLSLLLGSVLLFPLLLYLYRIFKGRVLPGG